MTVKEFLICFHKNMTERMYWCDNHDALEALRGVRDSVSDMLYDQGLRQDDKGEWVETAE